MLTVALDEAFDQFPDGLSVLTAVRDDDGTIVDFLAPYVTGERGSGEASRWTQGRVLEWFALRPELVVEITFDHVSDGRIRHGAKVQRWREDKAPEACTVDQLDQ